VTVSGLVVGDNAIPVVITAANTTTTKTYTVHVFVAPAAPVVSAPANGATTNNKKPTISGTGDAGATVTVKEGTTVICTALVAGDGTWACTPSADLGDGQHTFGVTQEHPVGNVSAATPHSFTVTSILPADLEVTQTESMSSLNKLKLTITVRNNGPNTVTGVVINDTFPATLTGEVWSWTCAGTACPAASGTGNLSAANATLGTLAANGTAVFTVTGTVKNWSQWLNTVTLVLPTSIVDNTPGNNSVTTGRYELLLPIVYR
jgi:uncharacterized repeat protein (TIGR01451 family)